MRSVPPFVSHCLELLAPLGPARARRMFGGHGLYVNDIFIALISDERLYLKADSDSRPAFEAAGCQPFAYSRRDAAAVTLGYWTAPEDALDSARAMAPWARRALAAALRAKAGQRTIGERSQAVARRPSAEKRRASVAKESAARPTKPRG